MFASKAFYYLKPFIPRSLQILLRRRLVLHKRRFCTAVWPIDLGAGRKPSGWPGWPHRKKFALVLTHDVETAKGYAKCGRLMQCEESLGLRSSFNFVPERYRVSSNLRHYLVQKGFEIGVHGLNHDGKLYLSKTVFRERAIRINDYLRNWGAVGFRSPAMHHKLDLIHQLNIEYDASTFDTDPFEPQSDGVGTIFPFYVQGSSNQKGYVELPYTLPQDFTLFALMKEKTIRIWKDKLDWIVENEGMALLNTHPDYMNFDGQKFMMEEYPADYYIQFLEHIKTKYTDKYWNPLPKEIARFWVSNPGKRQKKAKKKKI